MLFSRSMRISCYADTIIDNSSKENVPAIFLKFIMLRSPLSGSRVLVFVVEYRAKRYTYHDSAHDAIQL